MYGSFDSPTTDVSESISTRILTPGPGKFWVRGRDQAGNWGPASALAVIVNGNTVPLSATMIPRAFELKQNAPNPVLDETAISFAVPVESRVSLAIFDPQGRQLRGLVDRTIVPGFHTVRWDRTDDGGRRVPPGVYYYRFTASGRTYLRKLVALR
jgi:hypothetical protein